MERWIEEFAYRKIKEPFDERFICETHFNRLDILRIKPWNQEPLKSALLADRKVFPVYFNQRSVLKWNTICDLKEIREHYKRCLSTYLWDIEAFHQRCVLKCKKNSNKIVIQLSLKVHIYENDEEINSIKISQAFLCDEKIKFWPKLRGLMQYLEQHDRLPRDEI